MRRQHYLVLYAVYPNIEKEIIMYYIIGVFLVFCLIYWVIKKDATLPGIELYKEGELTEEQIRLFWNIF